MIISTSHLFPILHHSYVTEQELNNICFEQNKSSRAEGTAVRQHLSRKKEGLDEVFQPETSSIYFPSQIYFPPQPDPLSFTSCSVFWYRFKHLQSLVYQSYLTALEGSISLVTTGLAQPLYRSHVSWGLSGGGAALTPSDTPFPSESKIKQLDPLLLERWRIFLYIFLIIARPSGNSRCLSNKTTRLSNRYFTALKPYARKHNWLLKAVCSGVYWWAWLIQRGPSE